MYHVVLLSVDDPDNKLLLRTFRDRNEAMMYFSACAKLALKLGCIMNIEVKE